MSYISIPMDHFIQLESREFDVLIEEIANVITASEDRRRRDRLTQIKFRFAIKCLLLNLLKAQKLPMNPSLGVPLSPNNYTNKGRYSSSLSYRPFIDAYNGLKRHDFIKVVCGGFWDASRKRGRSSRITASNALKEKLNELFPNRHMFFSRDASEETIILRDKKIGGRRPRSIDYKDRALTKKYRNNLRIINECLSRNWYDLDLSDEGFAALYLEMSGRSLFREDRPSTIDFSARTLHRIFNNCSFKEGGRFFGGWWEGIPSKYRQYITINGKNTVEVDYKSMHPTILYILVGATLVGDAYKIPELGESHAVNSDVGRDVVKELFQKLLNGKSFPRKPQDYDANYMGIGWGDLVRAVINRHSPIASYFRTGYGIKLMAIDSQVAEKVLLYYAGRGRPVLPVHDSFLIHHAMGDELTHTMEEAFRDVLSSSLPVQTRTDDYHALCMEEYIQSRRRMLEDGSIVGSRRVIEEILDDLSNEYGSRLNAWREYSSPIDSRRDSGG